MVDPGANDPDQLMTNVDRLRARTLIVPTIPLLRAAFHLHCIVGRQGQPLEVAMSSYSPRRDEVVQQQCVKGPEGTTWTLDGLIDSFSRRVDAVWVVTSGVGVLDVILRLELLEALGASVVDVLSVGDELRRRRRSVGGRHFDVEDGWMV